MITSSEEIGHNSNEHSGHMHGGHVHSEHCSHNHGVSNMSVGQASNDSSIKSFTKTYCINNQLPRVYANLIVLTIIFSGAYLDMNYFSYCIKNPYDRAYGSVYMLILYVWAVFCYLRCSYTLGNQTKIEEFQNQNEFIYKQPIVNINYKRFNVFCEFCKAKKFERSSHCKICGICVLRRDHHCPGLGICVGYHNTQHFCNLMVAMIFSASLYLGNCITFFNNRKQIRADNPLLEISFSTKIWMIIATIFVLICWISAVTLLCQQLFYIYNDVPYHELMKKPHLETYWGLCVTKNENHFYNPYNKGFLANFYQIIGPTVLHLIFPLPKWNENYDIVENKEAFSIMSQPHPFKVHNYMKENGFPDFEENWKEQVKAMDPDIFMELAKKNYMGKHII